MQRVGFILKPDSEESRILVRELSAWLGDIGHQAVVLRSDALGLATCTEVEEADFPTGLDLVVTLGGDGTMLRAHSLIGDTATPVLGINLGRLGFLAPIEPDRATLAIEAALAGRLPVIPRLRLSVRTGPDGAWHALNDAVIHQGQMARLIELEAYLDGDFIASYRADGLIIASPTGSTAYSLAAGGPVLLPGQESFLLTPICAHALTMRPLVVPRTGTVTITMHADCTDAVLSVDGRVRRSLAAGDKIEISAAKRPLNVLGSAEHGYFDILRAKLQWGGKPPLRMSRHPKN